LLIWVNGLNGVNYWLPNDVGTASPTTGSPASPTASGLLGGQLLGVSQIGGSQLLFRSETSSQFSSSFFAN